MIIRTPSDFEITHLVDKKHVTYPHISADNSAIAIIGVLTLNFLRN